MPQSRDRSDSPGPVNVPNRSGATSPLGASPGRAASTARRASPVPSSVGRATPTVRQIPTPNRLNTGTQTPLAGLGEGTSGSGPGRSALAAAFEGSLGQTSPPAVGTPPRRPLSPLAASGREGRYGSLDNRGGHGTPLEDPEVVRRHLVRPSDEDLHQGSSMKIRSNRHSRRASNATGTGPTNGEGPDLDEFSSLKLQGGDITRPIYRWAEDAEAQSVSSAGRGKRSRSFYTPRAEPEDELSDINSIKVPGGFRRDFLRRSGAAPGHNGASPARKPSHLEVPGSGGPQQPYTSSFIEFLSLYGHFAGEELEDIDEEEEQPDGDYFAYSSRGDADEDGTARGPSERTPLVGARTPRTPHTPGGRRLKTRGENTSTGAALLLLKSFVGTGVLFLPKAFLNGGMLFSSLVLIGVAAVCFYCFLLLIRTRLRVEASYGDIGGVVYGRFMRSMILFSIVLSQVGFVAAYIVFTSQNLQAFIVAVSKCSTWIDIKLMVLMQLIIFLPLSLIRDISKLSWTALVADLFILVGLIVLYYFDIEALVDQGGISDINLFNPRDWTVFIGTAIFTFEGIGLIIPIQESMKRPQDFPGVLGGVMILITLVFTSMGALSYAAFGSSTKTVVLLNMPQDNKFVNAVQFLYSLAILLSAPLQLFPAIRIIENEVFTRSGKYSRRVKWRKNIFRFLAVIICAAIAWGGAADLDKFVALVGSFACVPLCFIYPPMLHFRAAAEMRWQKVVDVVLCVLGVVLMAYTSAQTIMSWAASGEGPKQPDYCKS